MMTDNLSWVLDGAGVLFMGVTLGVIFFGGLWWTVRRGAVSPTPTRWFLSSFILRNIIALAGFFVISDGQPLALGLSLLGFILGRALVLRWSRSGAPAALNTPGEPPCA